MKCPFCNKETDTLAYNNLINPACPDCFNKAQTKAIKVVCAVGVIAFLLLYSFHRAGVI